MANKPSPNSLIHCAECGEDYSATYKRCPFCGAKNAPQQSASGRSESSDLEDTYVFDGQDLFDDEPEDNDAPVYSRGGKRLAGKTMTNPFANADINWPRVITFVCSLIIIVAAMVIVFTVVYPQLRGDPTVDNSQNPSSSGTDPSGSSQSPDPGATDPNPGTTDPGSTGTDPGTAPSTSVPPADPNKLRGFTTNSWGKDEDGFALGEGESFQLKLTFDPVGWSGEVTYSISDPKYALVTANGNVTNVNPDTKLHRVILTITAGGITKEMPVFCHGVSASQPPATTGPSGGSAVTGTVKDAENGLNVRSGPGTTYGKIGSLKNGDVVTILEELDNGWYKISFPGANGAATEGYVSGSYIAKN